MNYRRMVKCWVSDTLDNHTRSYKWWLQKCHWWDQWKHISDGDNDGGWRFGSSPRRSLPHCAGSVGRQAAVFTHKWWNITAVACCSSLLLLLLQKDCCCSSWSNVWTNKHSFDVVMEAGENKKRWKKRDKDANEEASAASCIKCLQEIWGTIIASTFNYVSPLNTLSLLTSHDTKSITLRHNLFFASLDSVK